MKSNATSVAPNRAASDSGGPVYRPLQAIRKTCLDCSAGSAKCVKWCPCDGIHSTRCDLWPWRFGIRPETAAEKYGPDLLDPARMPGADVALEDLDTERHPPAGPARATAEAAIATGSDHGQPAAGVEHDATEGD